MMFKSLTTFRTTGWIPSAEQLQKAAFEPSTGSAPLSDGWAPVRDNEMFITVPGHTLLCYERETRSVPGAVIKRRAEEMAKAIERDTGRKPGRKEVKNLREQAEHELLAQAFGVRKQVYVWLDHDNGLIHLDTTTGSLVDAIATLIVRTAPVGSGLGLIQTNNSPAKMMADWLVSNEPPTGFTIDRDCQLKGENSAAITIKNMALDGEHVAVANHIKDGKQVKKLAMTHTFGGGMAAHFVLNDSGAISRIALDGIDEENGNAKDQADAMTAEFYLMVVHLSTAHKALTEALGGIIENNDPAAS